MRSCEIFQWAPILRRMALPMPVKQTAFLLSFAFLVTFESNLEAVRFLTVHSL